jgi:hypothetical protein
MTDSREERDPPPTPNPPVHPGALPATDRHCEHRWSYTRVVYCFDCGMKHRDWLEANARRMGRP